MAASLHAQESAGTFSTQPPNEDLYVYKPVPDIPIQSSTGSHLSLSGLWQQEPLLLTLVFTRCSGVCSPLLESLRSAVASNRGAGKDYRVVVLSFDPNDTPADMRTLATGLGEQSDPAWVFGVASPADIRRLVDATGFWFRWDQPSGQYDHPAVVMAIEHGRIVRLLAGAAVPAATLRGVVQEFRGNFVPSYALPGKVAFRCFEYDPARGRYVVDWGILLLILPGAAAALATACVFLIPGRRSKNTEEDDLLYDAIPYRNYPRGFPQT